MASKLDFFLLSILLFSLPLSEALKNIAWFLYIIVWFYSNRRRFNTKGIFSKDFNSINLLFVLVITVPYLVALFCSSRLDEWDGAWDVTRYGLFGWVICHSNYTSSKINHLYRVLVLSAFIGCALGIWEHFHSGARYVELHSVGHVNHSAIYLGLILGVLISKLLTQNNLSRLELILTLITSTLLFFVFLEMSARGAFIPLIIYALLMLVFVSSKRHITFSAILFAVIICFTAIYFNLGMVHKFINSGDGHRFQIFNTSLAIFQYSPIWGVGLENSKFFFTFKEFAKICNLLGISFDPEVHFLDCGHAHNLYMQSLVERGIFGSIPLVAFLVYWSKKLIKDFSLIQDSFMRFIWGSSLLAYIMVFIGGIFNTTLHHEHGILSIILFAFHYSVFSRYRVPKSI